MTPLQKIETNVLETMVTAHSVYDGRKLTEEELADRKATILLIQSEIKSRKEADPAAIVTV